MSAFPMVDPATAPARTAKMVQDVQASVEVIPDTTRAMATSPALLAGYLELSEALCTGRLRLAVEVNDGRGTVSAGTLEATRAAGVNDEEIAEIVGQVALDVLTYYFDKVADVEIDFPVVTA